MASQAGNAVEASNPTAPPPPPSSTAATTAAAPNDANNQVPNGHFVNGDSNGQPPPDPYYGYPPKGAVAGVRPENPAGPGGGTPTLNSLLQGRQNSPRQPPPGGAGPPLPGPPYGPPQQHPSGPHPGAYPPHWGPDYYRQRPPYGAPPPGQHPYPPPPHQQYPQYPGYPPQQPGGRYPPPPPHHQGQPPNSQYYQQPPQPQAPNSTSSSTNMSSGSAAQTTTTSSTSTLSSVSECPPPHPGSHEGKPSTTWTPPVQGSAADKSKSESQDPSQSAAATSKPNDDDANNSDPQRSSAAVRPTPSPTGSSPSRSMSPAVATSGQQQMPPRPPSGNQPAAPPSDQSKMASAAPAPPPPTQGPPTAPGNGGPPGPPTAGGPPGPPPGNYPMGPPPNMMYNNKGAPPSHMPHYGGPPGSQPPPGGYYGMRMGGPPGHPGPPTGGYGPPPPNSGYPGYGRQNNIPSGYPGQQQHYGGWNNQPPPHGPPGPPQGMGPPGAKGPRPGAQYGPRPPHPGMPPQPPMAGKGGYPPPPNSYNGPPNYNGPPGPPPGMQPPASGAPGYPPTSYPNSGPPPPPHGYPPNSSSSPMPPVSTQSGATPPTSSASGSTTNASSGPLGPDGYDESSQQSTLSQSSDRSDGRQTPKQGQQQAQPHSGGPASNASGPPGHPPQHNFMGNFSHHGPPGSPHSSAPSPGGSLGSSGAGPDGGYPRDGMASPSWQRPPASPVSTPQTSSRSSDSLSRLYEMDDHPDRRPFLDKLLSFMEEKGTPITQCPTISKNPLDLFRLYLYTKERGGYLECTKQKTWKDIAAQLGIGASSSGAYTLKKHYGKNLLPFECYYDRGGIDPGPILAQVEAQTKKKAKAPSQPPPAPSPGSQDSRDSYSNSNSNASVDHYGNYPPPAPGGYNNYPSGPPPGPPGPPGPHGPPPNSVDGRPPSHPGTTMHQVKDSPIRLGNPFDDTSAAAGSTQQATTGQGMPPGGYPPSSTYGGYPPPPPHSRPDSYPNSGAYPPSSYPPPQRPGWPPHQGYGPPPTNGGPPPSSGPPGAPDYRHGYYGPRPGFTPPPPTSTSASPTPGGPPAPPTSTVAGSGPPAPGPPAPPPNQNPYGQQPPYHDQYQPKPGMPPTSAASASPAGGPPPPSQHPAPPTTGPPSGPLPGPPSSLTPTPPVGIHAGPPVVKGPPLPPPGPPGMMSLRPTGPPPPPSGSNAQAPPPPPPQSYGASSSPSTSTSGGPPPPHPQGYPVRSAGPPQSQAPQRPPQPGAGPPSTYSYPGQRPPMYPGGNWQNRYPSPSQGYPGDNRSWGPQGAPPRMPPGAPPPQWGSSGQMDSRSYQQYGSQPTWMRPAMRPPFRPDMRTGAPSQVMPRVGPGGYGARGPSGPRNDLTYPHGSVEATLPLMMKRRKYTKVDVQPVDGWRLVMALRSGLLMESTWALDVLNILLFDDYTVSYFGLSNMPGLLEALLEHWRASLIAMFGVGEDLEASTEKSAGKRTRKRTRVMASAKSKKWYETGKELELHLSSSRLQEDLPEDRDENEIDAALGRVCDLDPETKSTVLTNKTSYTKRPRFSDEDVEVIDRDETLFVNDNDKEWDDGLLTAQGRTLWEAGGGNSTDHIATHFASDLDLVPFVRLLKDLGSQLKKDAKELEKADQPLPKENGIKSEDAEENAEPPEDIIDRIKRLTGIVVRDPDAVRQRWKEEALEDENYVRDEPSLHLVSEANDSIGKRVVCVSTIFRNLSFVPGNEYELSENAPFLAICGRLLLLKHWHPPRNAKKKNYDRGEEEETIESCTSLTGDDEWWWEYLHVIRENVMVALANIAGSLELNKYGEDIARPILHGLLEWAVSSSAYAQDPFPNVGPHSPISPQGLAIETLCKLCLHESNVDLMLTTPPYSRIEKLTMQLARKLNRYENQVLREFSINLLYYLSAADSGVARTIATSDLTIGLLLGFVEQAEQNALVIAQKHGVNALRDNPDSMGTSLDMMRRAASTLSNLSRHQDNIALFMRHEQRLLDLVMSQILDQGVASILSHVLFNIGVHSNERMRSNTAVKTS